MGGGREAEKRDGHCCCGRHDSRCRDRHGRRANEHRCFAGFALGPSALHEKSGEPSSTHASETGDEIDDGESACVVAILHMALVVEAQGQPEQIEPPGRIGEEFRDCEAPGLLVSNGFEVGNLDGLLFQFDFGRGAIGRPPEQ